jgi:hypothetical protein
VRFGGVSLNACEKLGSFAFYNCTKFTDDGFPTSVRIKIGVKVFTNTPVVAKWAADLPVYFAAGSTYEQ